MSDFSKLEKLLVANNITEQEAMAALKGARNRPSDPVHITTPSETIKYLYFSDPHIGHQEFLEPHFLRAVDVAKKEGVDFIVNPGDHLEGMSNRPGHIYELSHVGFDQQINYASDLYNQFDGLPHYGIDGNHDCLDKDTELLTQRGWVFNSDIQARDKVLSLNLDTGFAEWSKITEIIRKDPDEEHLYRVESNNIDILCTGKHRVLHQKRNNKLEFSPLQFETMNNISGRVSIPVAGIMNSSPAKVSNEEIQLSAWILTDGYIKEGQNVIIYQSKPIDRIINIARGLGLSPVVRTRTKKVPSILGKILKSIRPCNEIYFSAEDSKKIFKFISTKEQLPDWCWKLNKEQFSIFLEELVLGDGSHYKGRDCVILYGNKHFLSEIQSLCMINGTRATLVKSIRGDYRLNISQTDSAQIDIKPKKKRVSYTEQVWCLTVPYGNFAVRRNGKSFFTGNSWYFKPQNMGVIVGKELEKRVKGYVHLGQDEGDLVVGPGCTIKLFHANDGSAYACSYKLQKLIESFSGGDKPNILHSGHYHKALYMFTRNIHGFESATLCGQSRWMRGKKIAAHTGFGTVQAKFNEKGVTELQHTFYPCYD